MKNLKSVPRNLLWILEGPSHTVIKQDGYKINDLRCNTTALDEKKVTQNSSVSIVAKPLNLLVPRIIISFMQT